MNSGWALSCRWFISAPTYLCYASSYLTLLWVAIWVLRFEIWPKALSQTVHWYGVAELWVVSCFCRWAFCRNRLWHTTHSKGRSPARICTCSIFETKCLLRKSSKRLYSSHLWAACTTYDGCIPEWIFLWAVRFDLEENDLPQLSQECLASPECMWSMWDSKLLRWPNSLRQKLQTNGFFSDADDDDEPKKYQ